MKNENAIERKHAEPTPAMMKWDVRQENSNSSSWGKPGRKTATKR